MTTIAELVEDRTVEGVFAVARKQRLRTKKGAPYLALELVDPSGRIEARVWSDVELLDRRFAEGDAVRVLGRVERFGDRLQLEVRAVEPADDGSGRARPAMRRDADELDGFLEFLAAEIAHPGLAGVVRAARRPELAAALRSLPAAEAHHSYAGGLLEHTVGVATLCRETAQLHPRLRADLLLAAALLHDVGRVRELAPRPGVPPDRGGAAARPRASRAAADRGARDRARGRRCAPSCCTPSPSHHDRQAARTAEAAVLYHANQLDAVAATRRRRLTPPMLAIVLALGASVAWGVGDFLGGLESRDARTS